MEEYGNNGIFDVDRKQMWTVNEKQEIYLEWPKLQNPVDPNYEISIYSLTQLQGKQRALFGERKKQTVTKQQISAIATPTKSIHCDLQLNIFIQYTCSNLMALYVIIAQLEYLCLPLSLLILFVRVLLCAFITWQRALITLFQK